MAERRFFSCTRFHRAKLLTARWQSKKLHGGLLLLFLAWGMADCRWAFAKQYSASAGHLIIDHSEEFAIGCVLLALLAAAATYFYVTRRRRNKAEEAILATQNRLTAVLAALPDAAFVLDASGRVVEVLRDASQLFSVPEALLPPADGVPVGQGRFLEELLPIDTATQLRELSRNVMRTGASQEIECNIGESWFEVRLSALAKPQPGTSTEAVCLVREITARIKMERSVQQAAMQAQVMNNQLRQLDQIKSDLLSAVSHEIRTPLTSIFGFVVLSRKEFLKRIQPALEDAAGNMAQTDTAAADSLRAASGRVLENLRIVQEEGARLGRLVDDLLDLSRIESGKTEWRDESCNISDIIDRSVKSLASRFAGRKAVRLLVDVPSNLPTLFADKDRLQQVLVNLLDNALKFTEEGTILLGAQRTNDNSVELWVQDSGSGIPSEELEHVFEKFHQSHGPNPDTTLPGKGSGLGLAICRNIVEHYGGSIRAVSPPKPGATGTKIVVELPAAPFATGATGARGARGGAAILS